MQGQPVAKPDKGRPRDRALHQKLVLSVMLAAENAPCSLFCSHPVIMIPKETELITKHFF